VPASNVNVAEELSAVQHHQVIPVVAEDKPEKVAEVKTKKPKIPIPASSDSDTSSSSSSSSSASDTDKKKKRKRKKNKRSHAKTQQPATDMVAMLTAALQNGKYTVNSF
jgi:hypothetical protein